MEDELVPMKSLRPVASGYTYELDNEAMNGSPSPAWRTLGMRNNEYVRSEGALMG